MGKKGNWSWSCALIGAASAVAASIIIYAKPKDPTFHLTSISLTSFKLNLSVLDAELILTVRVTNPNIAPIHYSSTTISIYYDGSLLGSAQVEAGAQPPRSCQLLRLPTRLNGIELGHHAVRFFADVAKQEMVLDADVVIGGTARVLGWDHKFKVRVDSTVNVDPVFLEVIDQERPTGEIVSAANEVDEAVVVAEFDLDKIKSKRHGWGIFRDRRPDLYKVLLTLDGMHPKFHILLKTEAFVAIPVVSFLHSTSEH